MGFRFLSIELGFGTMSNRDGEIPLVGSVSSGWKPVTVTNLRWLVYIKTRRRLGGHLCW